jgi:hypothetical protein
MGRGRQVAFIRVAAEFSTVRAQEMQKKVSKFQGFKVSSVEVSGFNQNTTFPKRVASLEEGS